MIDDDNDENYDLILEHIRINRVIFDRFVSARRDPTYFRSPRCIRPD